MSRTDESASNDRKGNDAGLLDRAVDAVRVEAAPASEADAARRRVWQRLQDAQSAADTQSAPAAVDSGKPIKGCADVRALLGAYRAGTLSPARQLLVQMHLRDCVTCREAHANRSPGRLRPWQQLNQQAAVTARPTRYRRPWTLAAAAVVLGAGTWLFGDAFRAAPEGPRATLENSEGAVYLLAAGGQRTLPTGGELLEREWLRTPRDSRATLRLRDGSRLEMKPHTEVGVSMNRKDLTVHLERGSVVVHAAEPRSGHLIVATDDARVVVTDSVFSVNRGTKGTRVSVLEGNVRVDWRGEQRMLAAGQQLSTTRFINGIPIRDEVAWSGLVQQQASLLNREADPNAPATQALGGDIRWPQLRYGSNLLDRLPADTLLFVAVPNDKDALDGAKALIDKQMRDNAVLNPMWKDRGTSGTPALGEVFRRARALSEHLGDEIVLAFQPSSDGRGMRPVVMAEVKRPGLRPLLERELVALGARDIQLLDRAGLSAAAPARPPEAVVLVDDGLVALAPTAADLTRVLSSGGLGKTAFGQRLAESYRDGAGMLFAADLGAITSRAAASEPKGQAVMQQLGVSDARYLVVEQEQLDDSTQNRATVSFAGPRTGVASWLAAPAPMGALDFVTPSASFAAAFVVKEPALVLDDLLRLIETLNPGLRLELAQLEARTGVQLRADIAATLGNDLVAAIDGPLLPVPSWKLVMEVQDPGRLAHSLERLVGELNRAASTAGRPGLKWDRKDTASGLKSAAIASSDTFTLKAPGTPFEAHLVFVDGYLVMAPNEQMLQRAVRARQGGQVLRGSWRFRQLLPPDREANFSAVVYHNLGEAASAVAGWVGGRGALQAEQEQGLDRLVREAKPGLFYVYGGSQDIQVASTGGFFGVTLEHVLGSAGLSDLLSQRRGTITP
jgi:FecR protein/Putative zinc-finger